MTHLPGDLGSLIRPHRIRISGAIQQERRPIGDSRPELGRQGPELVRQDCECSGILPFTLLAILVPCSLNKRLPHKLWASQPPMYPAFLTASFK